MLRDDFSEFKANDNAAEETDMVSGAASWRDWQVSDWEEGKEGREGERREEKEEWGRAESDGREGGKDSHLHRQNLKNMQRHVWFEVIWKETKQ